jgi:hypothetical protein
MGIGALNNTFYNLSNENYYSVNITQNFLSNPYIEFELEFPTQNSLNLIFSNMADFFISLVIIDIDESYIDDTTINPPYELKKIPHYNIMK